MCELCMQGSRKGPTRSFLQVQVCNICLCVHACVGVCVSVCACAAGRAVISVWQKTSVGLTETEVQVQ